MYNRKLLTSQISHRGNLVPIPTAREKLVPIRHTFHTNISHFVKNAHVLKLYVAYMRKKLPPNLLHFALDSNSSHGGMIL